MRKQIKQNLLGGGGESGVSLFEEKVLTLMKKLSQRR
jgi:hypothetical protein